MGGHGMRTSLDTDLLAAVERLKQELKADNNASTPPASGSLSSSKGMLSRLLPGRKRTNSFEVEVPAWVARCDQLCEQIKNSPEDTDIRFMAAVALISLVNDQRANHSSAKADGPIKALFKKLDALQGEILNKEELPSDKKAPPPLPRKLTKPEAEAILSKPDQDLPRRSRADAVAPPRIILPVAPPKSNPMQVPMQVKRARGGLTPSPSSSPTGSPEHKAVRRESMGKKVELSDLAGELDVVAKQLTSQFSHTGRSSMAAILRKGDHVKDPDVMLFVKYYQEEKSTNIKAMVKNAFPPNVAVLLDKKPGDLIRTDKEAFKAAVAASPQEMPKLRK